MELSQLQINTFYTCSLSNLKMLVIAKIEASKQTNVTARYFNTVTGRFETTLVNNYQLNELNNK
jgi:hypothetical protein